MAHVTLSAAGGEFGAAQGNGANLLISAESTGKEITADIG